MFQLHVTAMNMLERCGIQFERRYLRREKIPPGAALIVGVATDKSVMADLAAKRDTGELLATEEVESIARDSVVRQFDQGSAEPEARDESIDAAVTLARLHHRRVAPEISTESLHLQRSWTLDVRGLNVQLAGTIDIQEGMVVRDLKTSGRMPAADEADRSPQLTMYAMAVSKLDQKMPEAVQLDYLVRGNPPSVKILRSHRTKEDFPHLLARVERASKVIQSGMFSPAPLDSWWCSAKWCGYHATCPYARRPVRSTKGESE